MKQRLALVVQSIPELKAKLTSFLRGEAATGMYSGNGNSATAEHTLEDLAARWARGEQIDWTTLYDERTRPRRIRIPVYPFQRKTCLAAATPNIAEGSTERVAEDSPRRAPDAGLTKQRILAIIEELFLVDEEIEEDRPFFELGLTSMNLNPLVNALNREFAAGLDQGDLFNYPTVRSLANRLSSSCEPEGDALESVLARVASNSLDIEDAIKLIND